jgi:hypothetical protein
MEKEREVFDVDWREFVDKVFQKGGAPDWPAERELTPTMVRGILVSLAYMLWVLGQWVKKLEREE